jgi:hypothetical protein
MLLSTILISSCAGVPIRLPAVELERCIIVLKTDQSPDGYCRCHQYIFSHEKIGRISESENKPRAYCDRFIGFHPETGWIPLLETIEEAYKTVEDQTSSFKKPDTETPEDIKELTNVL